MIHPLLKGVGSSVPYGNSRLERLFNIAIRFPLHQAHSRNYLHSYTEKCVCMTRPTLTDLEGPDFRPLWQDYTEPKL